MDQREEFFRRKTILNLKRSSTYRLNKQTNNAV